MVHENILITIEEIKSNGEEPEKLVVTEEFYGNLKNNNRDYRNRINIEMENENKIGLFSKFNIDISEDGTHFVTESGNKYPVEKFNSRN